MSFTATRSPQGIEFLRAVADNEIIMWPGDPGVTFTRGDKVVITGGVLALATDSSASAVGIVQKTIVCPAASQAFPIAGPGGQIGDLDGAAAKTLIPIRCPLAHGVQVERGTFANHLDDTVISYTAGTRAIALTTGLGTDDYGIGALLYVYEGAGKGQLNIVEDYDHAGGAANLLVICHRAFDVALDSTSKVIILSGSNASSDGRSLLSGARMDLDTVSQFDIDDGYDDGDYAIYGDFLSLVDSIDGARYQLTVPAIKYSDFA